VCGQSSVNRTRLPFLDWESCVEQSPKMSAPEAPGILQRTPVKPPGHSGKIVNLGDAPRARAILAIWTVDVPDSPSQVVGWRRLTASTTWRQ